MVPLCANQRPLYGRFWGTLVTPGQRWTRRSVSWTSRVVSKAASPRVGIVGDGSNAGPVPVGIEEDRAESVAVSHGSVDGPDPREKSRPGPSICLAKTPRVSVDHKGAMDSHQVLLCSGTIGRRFAVWDGHPWIHYEQRGLGEERIG